MTRKRKIREVLTVTDSTRLLYTAPSIRVGTMEYEREDVGRLPQPSGCEPRVILPSLALHRRALSDEWPAWFSFLVFWALAGACKRHGVGRFIVQFTIINPGRLSSRHLKVLLFVCGARRAWHTPRRRSFLSP